MRYDIAFVTAGRGCRNEKNHFGLGKNVPLDLSFDASWEWEILNCALNTKHYIYKGSFTLSTVILRPTVIFL